MAKFKVLSIRERQKLLYEKGTDEKQLKEWGDFYKEEGRIYDALEFYAAASLPDSLGALRRMAIEEGNLFLYRRVMQELKAPESASELSTIQSKCDAAGKETYARAAAGLPPIEEPEHGDEASDRSSSGGELSQ